MIVSKWFFFISQLGHIIGFLLLMDYKRYLLEPGAFTVLTTYLFWEDNTFYLDMHFDQEHLIPFFLRTITDENVLFHFILVIQVSSILSN